MALKTLISLRQKKMNKLPKNIKINVSCLPPSEKDIKQLLINVVTDYSTRYGLTITDKPMQIHVCLVEYDIDSKSQGLTAMSDDCGRMLIQVRDPFMNDWEGNPYMVDHFLAVLCHEFVHAAQFLCNRKGFTVKGLKYDKLDEFEEYCFEPMEMEARMLEYFYAEKYGDKII